MLRGFMLRGFIPRCAPLFAPEAAGEPIFCPRKRISPAGTLSNPATVKASVDLPQPLSPTNASTSPGARLRETPSTARIHVFDRRSRPAPIGKYFLTSQISSSGGSVSLMEQAFPADSSGQHD